MALLPNGLELVEDDEPISLPICRANPDGPWFQLYVRRISVDRFRSLSQRNQAPQGTKPGSKAAKLHEQKFIESFCRTTLSGWEGLTVDNWEELLPGAKISGDSAEDWRDKGKELPFSLELAGYLYQKVWPDKFSDLILRAIKEGVDESEQEDEDLKES